MDTVEIGFSLALYPRVLNTRELLVSFGLSISDLNALEQFGDVQLPEVSRTQVSQQVILRNDETLVISGFERNRAERRAGTSVSSSTLAAGGGRVARLDRIASVIIITPRILSRLPMR